jgi:hypothetical protein
MPNGDGGLQPLEQDLELAAERVRAGFELTKTLHL